MAGTLVVVALTGGVAFGRSMRSSTSNATVYTYDLANRTYPLCGDDRSVPLVRGQWQEDPLQPERGTVEGFSEQFADVTGDGEAEAIVSYDCTFGVSNAVPYVVVLMLMDGRLETIGGFVGTAPSFSEDRGRGTALTVTVAHYTDTDPQCCPSMEDVLTYTWDGFGLTQTNSQTLPTS